MTFDQLLIIGAIAVGVLALLGVAVVEFVDFSAALDGDEE